MFPKPPKVESNASHASAGTKEKEKNEDVKKNTANANTDTHEKSNGNKKKKFKNNRRNGNSTFKPKYKKPSVKCNVPELKDRIFDCTGIKQPEEYKQAKEALEAFLASSDEEEEKPKDE